MTRSWIDRLLSRRQKRTQTERVFTTAEHPMTVEYARQRAAQILAPHLDEHTIETFEHLLTDIAYALLVADRDANRRGAGPDDPTLIDCEK